MHNIYLYLKHLRKEYDVMRGRFIKGITTGAVIGTIGGMLLIPQMDRSTRRKIKKSRRFVKNSAEELYSGIMDWVK